MHGCAIEVLKELVLVRPGCERSDDLLVERLGKFEAQNDYLAK
jgi:hypothetical protein